MTRNLIVNADDLGLTLNITRGIINAHRNGIVTSTSVMVNLPASAESVGLVMEEAPRLRLGLHLNLTSGKPLTEYPDRLLGSNGHFAGKTQILPALADEMMPAIQDELYSQLQKFRDITGYAPDHLDSHHHITYVHPDITAIMVTMAQELQVPIRRPFSILPDALTEYIAKLNAPGEADIQAGEISEILEASDLAMPGTFIHSFFGDRTSLGDLLNDLVDVPDGVTELMCHPGIPDDTLRAVSGYIEPRQREVEALTHPATREVLVAQQITLATFEDLIEND